MGQGLGGEMKQDGKEDGQDKKKLMMPPGMQKQQENNVTIAGVSMPVNAVIAGVCSLIMILSVLIVSKFRRKRVYFRF